MPEASRWYLQAAQADDDAGLAERATRIALLANDDARAAQALKLWRQRAPQSLAMRAAEAALALRKTTPPARGASWRRCCATRTTWAGAMR